MRGFSLFAGKSLALHKFSSESRKWRDSTACPSLIKQTAVFCALICSYFRLSEWNFKCFNSILAKNNAHFHSHILLTISNIFYTIILRTLKIYLYSGGETLDLTLLLNKLSAKQNIMIKNIPFINLCME